MDLQPTTQTQHISDDQELAKVLAGVTKDADTNAAALQFEETPVTIATDTAKDEPTTTSDPTPAVTAPLSEPTTPSLTASTDNASSSDDLGGIKKDALNELRPLVDKLDLPPQEKFDTYLLLIRSTDDKALIAPAHAAAAAIPDETARAQALLDIIKEIDYLSGAQQ